MFNDLNNAANQGRQTVDDIFAETDKTPEGGLPGVNNVAGAGNSPGAPSAPGAEIETRRVGLTAGDETMEEPAEKVGGNKWFKIILILIVAAILILGGYLIYSKFFKANPEADLNTPAPVVETTPAQNQTSAPAEAGSFVATTSGAGSVTGGGESTAAGSPVPATTISEIPGINAPTSTAATTTLTTTTTLISLIDSDSDGLTDAEEKVLGTNINVIDTDNDGLSDYEEVKIYHTNPLSADTDGDGHLDGKEVNGGYDPNGSGKLIKEAATPKK